MTDFDVLLRETLQERAETVSPAPDAVRSVAVRAHRIRRRRRASAMAGVAAAVTAAVLAGALAALPNDRPEEPATGVSGLSLIDVRGLKGKALQPVPLNGRLYMVEDNGDVVRVDAGGAVVARGRPGLDQPGQEQPIVFGASTQSLFVSGGGLWMVGNTPGTRYLLQRLDPMTLKVVLRVPLDPENAGSVTATPTSIWATAPTTPRIVVRRDGRTGALVERLRVVGNLPPGLDEPTFGLVSVDEKAGVAWLFAKVTNQIPVVMPARISPGRLTVIGFNTLSQLTTGRLAPGDDGTLWAAANTTVGHLAPEADGISLRHLATGYYLPWAWSSDFQQFTATPGRLWALATPPATVPPRTTLVCLDAGTGEVLGRYPLHGRYDRVFSLEVTGDKHQVYVQFGSRLYTLHGPDRCLS
ncbi:hypothetical protein [Actinomadura harenae]|uniref:Uncharacterized protein n=1 Tax=Actinomadura harenae TaxID=2483351 RepID=A0A3M2LMW1_9ACTN|nr:hypothetical protein [Actinomadura harenae]RMI36088.1 hypothetical protein EBO15_39535 [Actinomadura harenae]